jgi:DNA-binding NarL/FixJ family response regulator
MRSISVLFVDDEPQVLEGLRDLLRPQRLRWELRFASTSQAALQEMERHPADVVVSDLHMPGLTGSTLLALIEAWHPASKRIVLSGHVRTEGDIRAHAVLAKPCDAGDLVRAIEQACAA